MAAVIEDTIGLNFWYSEVIPRDQSSLARTIYDKESSYDSFKIFSLAILHNPRD